MPFVFSFHPALRFYLQWKFFLKANAVVSLIFIIWDMLFTHLGVWGFNPRYICGFYIYNLPLEEVLFFFCIPYASLFTYHCLKKFFSQIFFPHKVVSIPLVVILLILAITSFSRLYTSVICLSLAFLLSYITFACTNSWLPRFYLSYLVILLPFFIVNGLLTGSWIDEPVVWYNDNETLRIRMLTIPFEDVFYGMLMLILNTWLYERFRRS